MELTKSILKISFLILALILTFLEGRRYGQEEQVLRKQPTISRMSPGPLGRQRGSASAPARSVTKEALIPTGGERFDSSWAAYGRRSFLDPIARANILEAIYWKIDQTYARLFQSLSGLDQSQKADLRRRLAEVEMEQQEEMLPKESTDSPTELQARVEKAAEIKSKAFEQLKQTLPTDAYAQLFAYDQSIPYTSTVEAIANEMRVSGATVNDQMQQTILNIYGDVMTKLPHATVSSPTSSSTDQMGGFDEKLAEAMSKSLPAEMYNAFMEAEFKAESKTGN